MNEPIARIIRASVALLAALVAVGPTPAPAHQDWDHPGVAAAVTSAVRHADGHVTASGWAVCPPGQDWGVGFHMFEDPNNPSRDTGMAARSAPVVKVTCDGQSHPWMAKSEDLYGGGVRTDGQKLWSAKMQSPTDGDWVHKDVGHQGTVQIGPGGPGGNGADLSVTNTDAPDPVTVGSTLTYQVIVANSGPATATGVVVTDPLPSTVTFQRATPSQGTCGRQNGAVTCSLGSVAKGGSASVSIAVTPNATGLLANTVSASSGVSDPDPSDNSATAHTIVAVPGLPPANLTITKTDLLDPTVVGGPVVYALQVTNAGPATARSVLVTDTLPKQVVFLLASPSRGTCTRSGSKVMCTLGDLAPSATATIYLLVIVTGEANLTNTAAVGSASPDPVTANNQDTEQTTVLP